MSVHAVAQTTQVPQQTAAQDQTGGAAGDFADLLKNLFGKAVAGGSLLDGQAVIDMGGTTPSYTPPPTPTPAPAPAPAPARTASNTQGNTTASTNTASATTAPTATTNANANGGNNGGSDAQSGQSQNNQQQSAPQSNSNDATAPATTTQAAAPAKAANSNGDDATTEETAAVMAAAAYVVQPTPAPAPAVAAVAQAAATSGQSTADARHASNGPVAPTGQQAQAASEDDAPEETPIWSANFLASTATTPQMAQQAANLSQITGSSGGSVSTQSTSGSSAGVAAPSASALVPDAVMALSGFFGNGHSGGDTGSGTGGQDASQQQGSDTDPALDPNALGLSADAQALAALATLVQSAGENVTAGAAQATVSATAATAAAPAANSAAEAALPQPTAQPPAAAANKASFAAQVQNSDETQEPQAARTVATPSAIEQLKMQIEKGVQAGSSTIKVQLTPESLGRVDVKLDIQNGAVKATITADRPETVALLKSDQAGMVQALQDAGLNADSSSLSFFLRGDQQQRQFAQGGRQGRAQSNGDGAADPLLDGVTATSAAASASGASALDISV